MTRSAIATVALFVIVVIALWVRHQHAREEKNRRLAQVLAEVCAKETRRIEAIRQAAMKPAPDPPRPCPLEKRVRIVRLESTSAGGGSLRDVTGAIAEQREPQPWPFELDVVDGRAFLYDYAAERVVCVGSDADDPHGTLVAY